MNSRRNFLQKISLGIGTTSLTSLEEFFEFEIPPHKDPLPAKQLRVALMGLGSYANRVAEAMNDCKLAKLTGVISGTPAKLQSWQQKYALEKKNLYNYNTVHQIKNNPDIDLVYITTPNSLHHNNVLQIAAAGKHVLCEKPLALNASQAREMIEACNKAKVQFYVGYRLHFEPHTREIIRMRNAGDFGKILHVNNYMGFRVGDPNQWRLKKAIAGGGAMMDVGIYALNGARYATGEEPVWVTAQESKTDPVKFKEVDETLTFQLGFPSGTIANCGTTYNFNHFERLYLIGEKGFAELSPAFGYGPIHGRTHLGPMNMPLVAHQTLQMDGIAKIMLNKEPNPNVSGLEGLKDMIVIDAVYESIRRNGERVYINK